MGIHFTQLPKIKGAPIKIGIDPNGNIQTYYDRIEEIWELDYTPNFKVSLFRCQWVKLTRGGITVDKECGMTIVDLNNIGYKDEPFVLATDVSQMFYVKDMSTKSKRKKRRHQLNDQ